MILYNTTYSIAPEIETDWLRWTKRFYVPAILETGLPVGYRLLRLLTEIDKDAVTFSLQLDFTAMEDYFTYQHQHADAFRQRMQHRFSSKYVSFDTLLEET